MWQPWYRLIIFTYVTLSILESIFLPSSQLFSLNFAPPLLKVQDDLNRWSKVPILLIESIAMIKMLVLPKMNYLFSIISSFPKYGLMVTSLYQNSIGKIKTLI